MLDLQDHTGVSKGSLICLRSHKIFHFSGVNQVGKHIFLRMLVLAGNFQEHSKVSKMWREMKGGKK